MYIKKVLATLLIAATLSVLSATELTFKLTPNGAFPFLTGGKDKYDPVGGGAFLDIGTNLFDFINIGPELGLMVLPKNNYQTIVQESMNQETDASQSNNNGEDNTTKKTSTPTVMIVPVGLQLGLYAYPFSRFEVGLGAAAGASAAISNGRYHYAPWYRAYGELNFRFNPSLSIGLNASWFDVQNNTWWGNPGAAGLTAGISVKFKLDTQKSVGRVDGSVTQDESVFPLLYTIYKENPFGTITVQNNETAEIRNVVVRFRADNYTSSEIECGRIKKITIADLQLIADKLKCSTQDILGNDKTLENVTSEELNDDRNISDILSENIILRQENEMLKRKLQSIMEIINM